MLLYGSLLAWQIDRWWFTPWGVASTWASRQAAHVVETGLPGGLSQTFTMDADRFDGVWLRTVVDGTPPRGELVVDLSLVRGDSRTRLERVALPAREAAASRDLRVRFRPVSGSRGARYALDVRHFHGDGGGRLLLAATREDALPDGRLIVGGVEQWGDLVMAATARRAALAARLDDVLSPWPAWMRSWAFAGLVTLACNALLAWACAYAAGLAGVAPRETPAPSTRTIDARAGSPAAWAAFVSVGVIALAGVAVAARPTGRFRAIDLIDALPDARVQTTWPSIHDAVVREDVAIFGRVHRAIVALPTSEIRWQVDVPRGAVLRFGAAMRPDMWTRESDGIQMQVDVEEGGAATRVAAFTIVPMLVEAHKRLHPGEVSLAAWAGQRVTLVFQSTPERFGNAVNDVPVWIAPRIEWPRDPSAGEARVVR